MISFSMLAKIKKHHVLWLKILVVLLCTEIDKAIFNSRDLFRTVGNRVQALSVSLKVNSVDSCHTIKRTVLKGVGGKGVIRCIPQTAAADLHALPSELADVDHDDNFISGDH